MYITCGVFVATKSVDASSQASGDRITSPCVASGSASPICRSGSPATKYSQRSPAPTRYPYICPLKEPKIQNKRNKEVV